MTHKQRVLTLLADGYPHSHHELYRLGCVAHSRISDLRRDGYQIQQWRDGDLYMYRLVGRLDEAATRSAASSSTPPPNPAVPDEQSADAGAPAPGRDDVGVLALFDPVAA